MSMWLRGRIRTLQRLLKHNPAPAHSVPSSQCGPSPLPRREVSWHDGPNVNISPRCSAKTTLLLRQVLSEPKRDAYPAVAKTVVAFMLPAHPSGASRLLLNFNDLALMLDVLALYSIVYLKVIQRAEVEVVKAACS